MAITPEASDHLDRMLRHQKEVAAGLIPADSPVDFIRSDWQPDENGKPGWFSPAWNPDQRTIDAVADAQAAFNAARYEE